MYTCDHQTAGGMLCPECLRKEFAFNKAARMAIVRQPHYLAERRLVRKVGFAAVCTGLTIWALLFSLGWPWYVAVAWVGVNIAALVSNWTER